MEKDIDWEEIQENSLNYWKEAAKLMVYAQENFKTEHFMRNIHKVNEQFLQANKKLIPYFGKDFRIEVDADITTEPLTMVDVKTVLNSWYEGGKAEKLFYNKNKYRQLEGRWTPALTIVEKVLREMDIEEIIKGRLLRKRTNPEDVERDFQPNTKISKYLLAKFEADESVLFGDDYFSSFRLENKPLVRELVLDFYSQILSSLKVSQGKVVLSINPVDYMLVAAGNENWRSCHNFIDGCWRTGGLSYAMDSESIIAYAYVEKKEYKKGDFDSKIPTKLWRQMVHINIDNRAAIFSREYPSANPLYSKFTRKYVAKILAKMHDIDAVWKVSTSVDKHGNPTEPSNLNNEEKDNMADSSYIISLTTRNPWQYTGDAISTRIRMKDGGYYPESMEIGAEYLTCPICGEKRIDCDMDYICTSCRRSLVRCYECGKTMYKFENNAYQDNDGDYYCSNCQDYIKKYNEEVI